MRCPFLDALAVLQPGKPAGHQYPSVAVIQRARPALLVEFQAWLSEAALQRGHASADSEPEGTNAGATSSPWKLHWHRDSDASTAPANSESTLAHSTESEELVSDTVSARVAVDSKELANLTTSTVTPGSESESGSESHPSHSSPGGEVVNALVCFHSFNCEQDSALNDAVMEELTKQVQDESNGLTLTFEPEVRKQYRRGEGVVVPVGTSGAIMMICHDPTASP